MSTPSSVNVEALHHYLCDWAGSDKLDVVGQINETDQPRFFPIAKSRDAHGSVLLMHKPDVKSALSNHGKEDERKWSQWWAKVAVRSGYSLPAVDPAAFAELVRLRLHSRVRVEFVFDTNALISGVGHWLVRLLGSRADLVRTVVTDFEVHDFGDRLKWIVENFESFAARSSFLSASRFLEHVHHDHPVWRRLDTEEETALFTAQSSNKNGKSPGRDTLLLRASRRAILDQVPGLRRFFVTGDQNVARAALHELPHGTVIAAYVNPLHFPAHLSPYTWLPANHDQGEVICSNLATFIWEALCLCTVIEVRRNDGARLQIRSHVRGENQFPSTWATPRMYITAVAELKAPIRNAQKPTPQRAETPSEPAKQTNLVDNERITEGAISQNTITKAPIEDVNAPPNVDERENESEKIIAKRVTRVGPARVSRPRVWPLVAEKSKLLVAAPCTPNIPGKTILKAFEEIVKAIREQRAPDLASITKGKPLDRLQMFLYNGGFLDTGGTITAAGHVLISCFDTDDIDGVSQLCTAVEPYHHLIATLRDKRKIPFDDLQKTLKSADSLQGLARLLGQAVLARKTLYDGSRFVGPDEFTEWFFSTLDKLIKSSPLQEASIATLAEKALTDLGLSPVRFGRALRTALEMPAFSSVEPSAGGTAEKVLNEQVCSLSATGLKFIDVSADGLYGIRSLKKRSK